MPPSIPVDFAFLDSGTGGLPYMQYLREVNPTASCMYLADTKNFPYGQKTQDEILVSAIAAVTAILTRYKPTVIVVACNTISVTALDSLRKKFPTIPFVGTVPAIKLATKLTKNCRIGLLATKSTVANSYTKRLEKQFAQDCIVEERGDPDLVNFIEHNLESASQVEIEKAILPSINFFTQKNVDIIILGCTHFLRIASQIQEVANKVTHNHCQKIRVIDSREGVVRQAIKVATKSMGKKIASTEGQLKNTIVSPQKVTSKLFITGSENENKFYEKIASKYTLSYGGII